MNAKKINILIERRKKLIAQLTQLGPMIEGSLYSMNRICGTTTCACRTDLAKRHPAHYFAWKEKGKTKSLYVPVSMVNEAKEWSENYKKFKKLGKEISEVQRELLRIR